MKKKRITNQMTKMYGTYIPIKYFKFIEQHLTLKYY